MIKVLIVEDEILVREALRMIVNSIDCELMIVGEGTSGREAIELDRALNPHLVILDTDLPGISGIKAAETIKKANENKAVVLISPSDNFDLLHTALVLGINDYILKPIKKEELKAAVKRQIYQLKASSGRMREMELNLMDRMITRKRDGVWNIFTDLMDGLEIRSQGDLKAFKASVFALVEKMMRLASLECFNRTSWRDCEMYLGKVKALHDIQGIKNGLEPVVQMILDRFDKDSLKLDDLDHTGRMNEILEPALRYIEDHFDEPLSLEKMAEISNVSPYYFSKLFKKEMGINFTIYVRCYRLEKAKEMLMQTDLLIVEIASRTGYYESGYFNKVFKRAEGMTPSQYRNKKQKA